MPGAEGRRRHAVDGATVIPAGGGEVVGDAPDRRVEILCEDDALHVTWTRFGPGRDGASPHVHRHHTDLFYVLQGELTVMLGPDGDEVAVPAGTLARVPPLVVHGFRNAGDGELRYLNFHAPGERFADYLRAVRDRRDFSYDQYPPPPDGARTPADAVITADGVVAERAGARARVLADVEEIGVAELRGEPAAAAEARHVHRRHVESLYVLEGSVTVVAATRELRVEAGSWVQLPPGVPHALALDATARVLEVRTPSCRLGELDCQPP